MSVFEQAQGIMNYFGFNLVKFQHTKELLQQESYSDSLSLEMYILSLVSSKSNFFFLSLDMLHRHLNVVC